MSESTSEEGDRKQKIRETFLERRDSLPADRRREASEHLATKLQSILRLQEPSTIAGYIAIRNEISITDFLFRDIQAPDEIVLPRVDKHDRLVFARCESRRNLNPGRFGVPEPGGPQVEDGRIDVFLVPGVAFGAGAERLGFGYGFYDRALGRILAKRDSEKPGLLSNQNNRDRLQEVSVGTMRQSVTRRLHKGKNPVVLGMCYDWQCLQDSLPTQEHDVRVDAVVTNKRCMSR